jgi:hypothetical protein
VRREDRVADPKSQLVAFDLPDQLKAELSSIEVAGDRQIGDGNVRGELGLS